MANQQRYTLAFVTVGGRLLTEHADMSMTRNSNATPQRTVAKGLAGFSPGPEDCEIDVTNAVPAADFEYDPGEDIQELNVVEIGVVGPGGLTAVSKGCILSDTFSHGVGKEASLSFKFMGSYPIWQAVLLFIGAANIIRMFGSVANGVL